MRDLSGGQKARVVFVDLSLQQPHLLLLDEVSHTYCMVLIDLRLTFNISINLLNSPQITSILKQLTH